MSNVAQKRRNGRIIRHRRVRKKIHGTAARPRLAVYRSNKHLTLQVIDDEAGRTIVSASTNEPSSAARRRWPPSTPPPVWASSSPSAPRPPASTKVVFDRGGYAYHGRIAAVAAAAREAGLEF